MNRQEPYIGMPIILDAFDEDQALCCGQTEIQPRQTEGRSRQNDVAERQTESHQHQAEMHMNQSDNQSRQPMALAMAYVPWQRWTETYPLDEGLKRGTIFPDLDLPFEGRRQGGMRR